MTDDELDQRLRESILSEDVHTSRIEAAVRAQVHSARPRQVPGWSVAAAALIATVLAGGLSYRAFIQEQSMPVVCSAAMLDHQAEIVRREQRSWLTERPAIQALAEKKGIPASALSALDKTEYRLERARLCFLNKHIFLHLVYTKSGQEYSVYLRSRTGRTSVASSVRDTQNLAYFQTPHVTAVFVSQGADVRSFARNGAELLQRLPS